MALKLKFYIFISLISLILVLPSAVKFFSLRYLFLSEEARSDSLAAYEYMRINLGLSATDLEVSSIAPQSDGFVYLFKYQYHQPVLSLPASYYKVTVGKGVVTNITKL